MFIATDFETGRIDGAGPASGRTTRLAIPPDPANPRYRQWFAFAALDARGRNASFELTNAGECTWARGFDGYRVFASDDGDAWRRVDTEYDGETLAFSEELGSDRVTYALFPPFSTARVEALVDRARAFGARPKNVAVTRRGAPVRLLAMGRTDAKAPAIWVIAQQHPGETMAGWFMEGLIGRLCEGDDAARTLLEAASVFIVPRMNPDGCALGNHRTNAAGLDLNRQWNRPSKDAPEVAGVRDAMNKRGADVFLDIHGDETIPYVFAQGTGGVPRRTAKQAARERHFFDCMLGVTPDFQTEHGYPNDLPGKANLAIGANWVGAKLGALAMTLEMPYTRHGGEDGDEWTPERARDLGAATASALAGYASTPGIFARRR